MKNIRKSRIGTPVLVSTVTLERYLPTSCYVCRTGNQDFLNQHTDNNEDLKKPEPSAFSPKQGKKIVPSWHLYICIITLELGRIKTVRTFFFFFYVLFILYYIYFQDALNALTEAEHITDDLKTQLNDLCRFTKDLSVYSSKVSALIKEYNRYISSRMCIIPARYFQRLNSETSHEIKPLMYLKAELHFI